MSFLHPDHHLELHRFSPKFKKLSSPKVTHTTEWPGRKGNLDLKYKQTGSGKKTMAS